MSAAAGSHRDEGQDDHALGFIDARAAERCHRIEERTRRAQPPGRGRGREVDHSPAGQLGIGDGRARTDPDRLHG